MDYLYLSVEEVLLLYIDLMNLSESDASRFVRDVNLLDSALGRPQNAAYYENADIVRQAATLLWGLVENHPFLDGNKRIAHLTALTFLAINGQDIEASEDDQFNLMIDIARGLSLEYVERWLRAHLV